MPTYAFQCQSCGREQETTCSWSARPAALSCACSGKATPVITGGVEPVVKGKGWQWDKRTNVPSMGRHVRTDQQQHKRYQEIVSAAKVNAKRARKNPARKPDDDVQLIGRVPLEAHEGVVEAMGDKLCWQKDTENLLKKTGFWTGE
jgi:putative FmdB family regulatory protein